MCENIITIFLYAIHFYWLGFSEFFFVLSFSKALCHTKVDGEERVAVFVDFRSKQLYLSDTAAIATRVT